MRKIYLSGSLLLSALFGLNTLNAQIITQTLNYTGGAQTFSINSACPTAVTITCYGAQGANGVTTASGAIGGNGGLGAQVSGIYTAAANAVLNVFVGGIPTGTIGGYNGGATAGYISAGVGGGGGGASDVRFGGIALTDRIIVAGGGGGGGNAGCSSATITGGNGGAGGGGNGTNGVNSIAGGSGVGATGSAGGAGGIGCSCCLGSIGGTGVSGIGGLGGQGPNVCAAYVTGGGGGGGFVGGGGGGGGSAGTTGCSLNDQGGGGGGAGGTNYFNPSFSNTVVSNGVRNGNGLVVISYSAIAQPTLIATPSSPTVCSGKSVTLSVTGASSVTWTPGSTTGNSLILSPVSNTVYTANANIGSGASTCAAIPAVFNVTVNALPTLTITNTTPTLCSGNTATMLATSNGTISSWIGPVTLTNGTPFFPPVSSTSGDTYTAYAISAAGCTNNATTIMTVVATPTAFIASTPSAVCAGGCATLTAGVASSYTWLPGNANTSLITVCPTITTLYTVIKSIANCVDTKTYNLVMNNLPGLLIQTSANTVCANAQVSFTAGGANTYTWATGTQTLPTSGPSNTIITSPAQTTTYLVTGSNGTCAGTTQFTIVTKPNPTITLAPSSTTLCLNNCATLTASGGLNYTWTASNGAALTGSSAIDCPTTTTSYSVAGNNSVGCVTGTNMVMVVYALPVFTVGANPPLVCVQGLSTLTAQQIAGVTYSWTTGNTTRTVQVSPLTTSVYSITQTFTSTGCNRTNTVQVAVFIPTFAITGPTATCLGSTVNICASGATTYTWSGGGNTLTGFPCFPVSPTVPTIYFCTGGATLNNVVCKTTNTYSMGIYLNPTVTAIPSKTLICRGDAVNLIGGGAKTYTWSDNQTGSVVTIIGPPNNSNNPNNVTYTVIGTDKNGCVDTATVLVRTSYCIGIEEINGRKKSVTVYPNPNNGSFVVKANESINLNIIDELGRIVREIKITEVNSLETKVSGLLPGVYFITGEKDSQNVYLKVIISE